MASSGTNKLLILAGGGSILVVLALAGLWLLRLQEIRSAYAAAAADCENGQGAGLLRAADALYGEDARPKGLRIALSTCALSDSVDDYLRAKAAADAAKQ